jgi:hypothetical protein
MVPSHDGDTYETGPRLASLVVRIGGESTELLLISRRISRPQTTESRPAKSQLRLLHAFQPCDSGPGQRDQLPDRKTKHQQCDHRQRHSDSMGLESLADRDSSNTVARNTVKRT